MYKPVKVNYTCLPSVSNVDNQEVKYWYPSSIHFKIAESKETVLS